MLPEMEKSLLDALNNQDLSSGYSPIYPNRKLTDVKELIVWIGVNFSIYPKVETPESLFGDLFNKRILLISFNDYKRYDLVWEYDIENFTKHHKDKINISIIEDYKKILPLITNFKKELRQKTGHLPYLGERNVNGDCFLLDKKIYRPDYDRIKADPTISLKNCICILLGIDDFSFISKIYGDLEFITEEQERYSWKDDFVILPETEANEPFTKTVATMKYREGWQDIISYTKDFISKINRELEEGNLKRVDHNALSGHHNFSFLDINQETHKCDFETLPFLKWAKESGYEIPDELAFKENDDLTQHRADSHTDHIIESDQTDDSSNISTEEKLHQHLRIFYPEVDFLYIGLTKLFKSNTGRSIAHATKEELKENALAFYSQNQSMFKHLKRKHIESDDIYDISVKQKKASAGKILYRTVMDFVPKDRTNANSLYEIAYKLCPETA